MCSVADFSIPGVKPGVLIPKIKKSDKSDYSLSKMELENKFKYASKIINLYS